jgi:hypothetical protein
MRAMEAAARRQQRDAKKRQRELERQTKEAAKLSAMEQARLEVETYDNALDVLLSVHKEQTDPVDWLTIASYLPPVLPRRQSHNELKARQRLAINPSMPDADATLEQTRQQDEREYQEAVQSHAEENAEWVQLSSLATRVLQGVAGAYIEAIEKLSPFTELAGIGSSLHFTVHNPRLIEVVLTTNGRQAIPAEVKILTSSGKVSVKAMPKPRFIDIYQDYICGCVLRVARELFALLPIETLLISASAETLDTTTGKTVERPFLSVAIPRATLNVLNFDRLDPSDSILSMTHRGDLKASRKTGDFESITPLTVSELGQCDAPASVDFNAVLKAAQSLRASLVNQCASLNQQSVESESNNGET